ncbi:hypothetical protein KKG31_02775 [Patescibacteria group bacterium]|nr:hypothetical protein [Patescibacteria group bacterium]
MSPYDDAHGLSFFVVHPEDASNVYFFDIGSIENQEVSIYESIRFLSTTSPHQ